MNSFKRIGKEEEIIQINQNRFESKQLKGRTRTIRFFPTSPINQDRLFPSITISQDIKYLRCRVMFAINLPKRRSC
jgi:hypothetical protein